jgi:hypothetical protein
MIKSVVGLFLNVRNLSPMSCEAHWECGEGHVWIPVSDQRRL